MLRNQVRTSQEARRRASVCLGGVAKPAFTDNVKRRGSNMSSSGVFLSIPETERRMSSPDASQDIAAYNSSSRRRSSTADNKKFPDSDSLQLEASRRKLTLILSVSCLLILLVLLYSFVRLIL